MLPLDKLDSVTEILNNSGNSKDQELVPLSLVRNSCSIGTFPTWSKIASFWRGTGGDMPLVT
jgi:hypothetical protein